MQIKKYILNIILITTILLFNNGCAEKNLEKVNNKEIQGNIKKENIFGKDILQKYSEINETLKYNINNNYYNKFVINTDNDDYKEIKNIKIHLSKKNIEIKELLTIISKQIGYNGYTFSNEFDDKSQILTFNNNDIFLYDILNTIENFYDVDIIFENNLICVKKYITFKGFFENNLTENDEISIKTQKNLENLLGSNSEIIINNSYFSITRSPNIIRKNKYIIENIINYKNAKAFLNLNIFKIDTNMLKINDLNSFILLDNINNIINGGTINKSPILNELFQKNNLTGVNDINLIIKLSFSLLEKEGFIYKIYDNFSQDLNNNSYINLINENNGIGRKLTINPSINNDLKIANLKIYFKEKNLIKENLFDKNIELKRDKYEVFSIQNDTFIISKISFPTNIKYINTKINNVF